MTKWTYRQAMGVAAMAIAAPAAAKEPEGQQTRQVRIAPYIEANQVLSAELSPNSDSVT